jgi:hypothetical protein
MGRRAGNFALALALGASVALGGCASAPTGTPVAGCPLDRISGVLEPLGPPGSLRIFDGGDHLILTWGDGTRTLVVDGVLSVVAPDGTVSARVGDRVTLTGGRIRAGEFLACGPAPAR